MQELPRTAARRAIVSAASVRACSAAARTPGDVLRTLRRREQEARGKRVIVLLEQVGPCTTGDVSVALCKIAPMPEEGGDHSAKPVPGWNSMPAAWETTRSNKRRREVWGLSWLCYFPARAIKR